MFKINGITWQIQFVQSISPCLMRSDGSYCLGMTDCDKCTVYLSNRLRGTILRKVLAHELCHCFCVSYGILMPIEQEEYLADWISLHGADLVHLLDDLMLRVSRKRGMIRAVD